MSSRALSRAALAAIASMTLIALANPAGAGGGHGGNCPPTDTSGPKAAFVALEDNCFIGTVTRVDPGTTVTWTNRDQIIHTVTGVGGSWGDRSELGYEGAVSYTFQDPGIYPYFCAYHPGMIGVVVVGDGSGLGPADSGAVTTSGGTVTDLGASSGSSEPAGDRGISASQAVGLVLAAGLVGFGASRLRRRRVFDEPIPPASELVS